LYYKRVRRENSLEWKAEHQPDIQLTAEQFRSLPPGLQALFKTTSVQTGIQEYTTYYVRKVAGNDERALRATPEWQAEHNPAARLNDRAYRALPARLRALGWVEESVQNGMQSFHSEWRRMSVKNIAANARRRLESTLEWKVDNNVDIALTDAEYEMLIPRQRDLGWNKQRVQVDRYVWEERWMRNSVRPPIAPAAAAPRAMPAPPVQAPSMGARLMNMVRGRGPPPPPPSGNEDPM
jgi:hypothetical protein